MGNKFVQHRDKEPFEDIKSGRKTCEIRFNDEKRQNIKIGQIINIVNRDFLSDNFDVRVVGLSRFYNFEDLYYSFGDKIKTYEKEILSRVYSKDKEEKYGVLVIHFKLV